jgi:hypothetical protein
MGNVKITGLDQLQRKLKKIERNAKAMDGEQSVPFDEVLTTGFLRKNTKFTSVDEIMDLVGVKSQEDFEKLEESKLDVVVREHSSFKSWQEMIGKAAQEWGHKKLFS